MAVFRWNEWNLEHIARHGVGPEEAEQAVNANPAADAGGDRYKVWGPTENGRFLQVVFVLDPDDAICVIHARDLTDREKKNWRRRNK